MADLDVRPRVSPVLRHLSLANRQTHNWRTQLGRISTDFELGFLRGRKALTLDIPSQADVNPLPGGILRLYEQR